MARAIILSQITTLFSKVGHGGIYSDELVLYGAVVCITASGRWTILLYLWPMRESLACPTSVRWSQVTGLDM